MGALGTLAKGATGLGRFAVQAGVPLGAFIGATGLREAAQSPEKEYLASDNRDVVEMAKFHKTAKSTLKKKADALRAKYGIKDEEPAEGGGVMGFVKRHPLITAAGLTGTALLLPEILPLLGLGGATAETVGALATAGRIGAGVAETAGEIAEAGSAAATAARAVSAGRAGAAVANAVRRTIADIVPGAERYLPAEIGPAVGRTATKVAEAATETAAKTGKLAAKASRGGLWGGIKRAVGSPFLLASDIGVWGLKDELEAEKQAERSSWQDQLDALVAAKANPKVWARNAYAYDNIPDPEVDRDIALLNKYKVALPTWGDVHAEELAQRFGRPIPGLNAPSAPPSGQGQFMGYDPRKPFNVGE